MTHVARFVNLSIAVLAALLLGASSAAAACTTTFTGTGNPAWNEPTNWSTGHVPTPAEDVCIPIGKSVEQAEFGNVTGKSLDIAAGASLKLSADTRFAGTNASFDGDVTNAGTLTFDVSTTTGNGGNGANPATTLAISAGHALINQPGGTVNVAQSRGRTTFAANVTNQSGGTVSISMSSDVYANSVASAAPTWTNAGTFTIATGGSWSTNSGSGVNYTQSAGATSSSGTMLFQNPADRLTVSGGAFGGTTVPFTPLFRQGELALTGGSGTVRIRQSTAVLVADVAPAWTIRIEQPSGDTSRLVIPAGQVRTNRGTIRFASDLGAGITTNAATQIEIRSGARLINEGTIVAEASGADTQEITVADYDPDPSFPNTYKDKNAFVQAGTLDAQHNLSTPPFTQTAGTTTLAGGRQLTAGNPLANGDPGVTINAGSTLTGSGQFSARTLTNKGTVAPTPGGASQLKIAYWNIYGTELQGGDYVQTSTGTLRVRFGATGTGLTVGGSAKLAGTVDLAPASGFTPPAGATYPVVRLARLDNLVNSAFKRSGTFATVTGDYAPTYEQDGADVTIPTASGASQFTIDDLSTKEGDGFTFTIRRTGSATGTASVRWAYRETGSALIGSSPGTHDVPFNVGNFEPSAVETFTSGQTSKTVTGYVNGGTPSQGPYTFNDGTPEPDEQFAIHLSHPTGNTPIGRADGTVTIVNDDTDLQGATPSMINDGGPTTITLRGEGLTSRLADTLPKLTHAGRPAITATSFTPSSDGKTATVVFDTAGATPLDSQWSLVLTNANCAGCTKPITIVAATGAAKPYVQAFGPSKGRGALPSDHYLAWGNAGSKASGNALLRFTGFPTGAAITLDHVPAGASAQVLDGVAGRTVIVAVGKIASGASDWLRVRYTPTTTIPGHTILRYQATISISPNLSPALTGQTASSAASAPLNGADFATDVAFSGGGAATIAYTELPFEDVAPTVTHEGSTWTFSGATQTVNAAPRAFGEYEIPKTKGLLKIDFNGGEFQLTGPVQQLYGAYELKLDRFRLTKCMLKLNLINQDQYTNLLRLAQGAFVLKGALTAAGKSATFDRFVPQAGALDAVMSGAWEKSVAGSAFGPGALDIQNNPNDPFLGLGNEEQLLYLGQLCRDHKDPDEAPDPVYVNGEYQPSAYIQELLQSFDPNEKSGTAGGGAQHAVTSDKPLTYRVAFENKSTASAAAQKVVVKDHLDASKVDLSTFALGPIAFGDAILTPPDHVTSWTTFKDLRPAQDVIAKVEASLITAAGPTQGNVEWTLTSLDPSTGLPTTDPEAGLLPPNAAAPEGEGSVTYSVRPKAGIDSGTTIASQVAGVGAGSARILFDGNAPIDTNAFTNLIDDDAPTSAVQSVAAGTCGGNLTVTWAGSDPTSAVATYRVFVKKDDGSYDPWNIDTDKTSATFQGEPGHTYAFDVQAIDVAGNVQTIDRADAKSAAPVRCPDPTPAPATVPPVTTPTPAPVRPWVTVGKLPSKLVKGVLAITVTCPKTDKAGCTGKVTVKATVKSGKATKVITLGTAQVKRLKAGKRLTLKVRLSKANVARLKKGSLAFTVTATPSAKGDARVTTATGTLKKAR